MRSASPAPNPAESWRFPLLMTFPPWLILALPFEDPRYQGCHVGNSLSSPAWSLGCVASPPQEQQLPLAPTSPALSPGVTKEKHNSPVLRSLEGRWRSIRPGCPGCVCPALPAAPSIAPAPCDPRTRGAALPVSWTKHKGMLAWPEPVLLRDFFSAPGSLHP